MRRLLPASTLAAALLLSACSSAPAASQIEGLSPSKALAKACSTSLKAGGVTADGTVRIKGFPTLHSNLTFSGANAEGSLEFDKGGKAEVIGRSSAMYLKGDKAFWVTMTKGIKLPAEVLSKMGGEWFRVGAKSQVATFRANILRYGDPRIVVKGCTGKISGVTAKGKGTVEDQPVLRYAAVDPNGTRVAVSASNEGEPYVLALTMAQQDLSIALRYSNYGATVDVSEPKPNYDLTPVLTVGAALTAQGLGLYN